MSKQPKLMNFTRMQGIVEANKRFVTRERVPFFINSELAVVYGDTTVFRMAIRQGPPFSIDDHRMGVVLSGELHANINLVEKRITAGTLVYFGPGTIISPHSFSDDLRIYGVGLFRNFPMPFAAGQMPTAFNGQTRDFQLHVGDTDVQLARSIVETLFQLVQQPHYHRPTATALVGALMHHYDNMFRQQTERHERTLSREQTIFDRFIYLVNQFSQREHRLEFYARKMCLTPRYLGTVVRQASGTTAKEWIDRAVITRAKVELRHSDKSIAQIAEEMNFANPSFFCKYFKRLTGVTPRGTEAPSPPLIPPGGNS